MKTHIQRLERIKNVLELGAAMNEDDDRLCINFADVASVVSFAISRHWNAKRFYLTGEEVDEWMRGFLEKMNRASGLSFPSPPPFAGVSDARFGQAEKLFTLLARACLDAEPSFKEIRQLVTTLIRLERQLEKDLVASGDYMDRDRANARADQFVESVLAFSRTNISQDDWNRVVDEVLEQ